MKKFVLTLLIFSVSACSNMPIDSQRDIAQTSEFKTAFESYPLRITSFFIKKADYVGECSYGESPHNLKLPPVVFKSNRMSLFLNESNESRCLSQSNFNFIGAQALDSSAKSFKIKFGLAKEPDSVSSSIVFIKAAEEISMDCQIRRHGLFESGKASLFCKDTPTKSWIKFILD